MVMNSLHLYRCDELDNMTMEECGNHIERNFRKVLLESVNWPLLASYQPMCVVCGAYSDKYIYIHFVSREEGLRAVNKDSLGPVAEDSCVEIFFKTPLSKEYWNFEFNCIGTVNASHRETRPNPTRLTQDEIAMIKRHSSCGTEPFGEKEGVHTWTLTVGIPRALVGLEPAHNLSHLLGNFYKCAGKTSHPHYVSWAPINSKKPNFHLPEFFMPIYFD